ncbi:hypothetical protein K9M16_05165 [Candidatus Babeliales bacterium]|nr:hypothetical protein [Candidatus Babeliales bacterium]MCF7910114.1 hypothetical protein [Candidatus Pacearchaeota archaeon]
MNPKFFDIFPAKNKKIKIIEKPKVFADYREKNCMVSYELIKQGFDVEFLELKVADYIVREIAIERKTINDFVSSMINKRLHKQLEEMQQYQQKLLIIEGYDEEQLFNEKNLKGVNPNAIRGFILSIIFKYQIPIIFTKNCEDTAKFISVLMNKKQSQEHSLNITKKNLNKKERKQFILESFPGIGPKNAKKLLEKYHTIQNIINASEEELAKTIGKKAEIFRLVKERY